MIITTKIHCLSNPFQLIFLSFRENIGISDTINNESKTIRIKVTGKTKMQLLAKLKTATQ